MRASCGAPKRPAEEVPCVFAGNGRIFNIPNGRIFDLPAYQSDILDLLNVQVFDIPYDRILDLINV